MRETILVSSVALTGPAVRIVATSNKLATSALGEHRRMGRLYNKPPRAGREENTYFVIVLVIEAL